MDVDQTIRELLDETNKSFVDCLDLVRMVIKLAERARIGERDATARAAIARAKKVLARHRKAKSR